MTAEQKLLLDTAACAVQGKQLNIQPESICWTDFLREAQSQGVFLPVFHILSQVPGLLPEEIGSEFSRCARRATARNMQAEFSQTELVSALEKAACPYVILKGEASAGYHPVPELRQLGDVDFLVPENRIDSVIAEMKQLGYEAQWNDHHWLLQKGRSRLEMHLEPTGIPEAKHRGEITEFFRTIYENSLEISGAGGKFRTAGEAHHGLILLLHMQHHAVSEGMGLRHLMDWACYVNATAEKVFWQQSLLPLLRQIGLFRFCAVMTKITAMYLGTCCPDWAEAANPELCRELMEDILAGGNFGQKNKERARAGNMLPQWDKNEQKAGRVRLLYRTLRKAVLRQHPQWEKKPVVLFFAMTGKAVRYTALYFLGKRPNLLKAASYANSRRTVYEQLHLFDTENPL